MNQRTVGTNGPAAASDDGDDDWASFLTYHLRELGWENTDLAEAIGIDRSQVSRWLRRESFPREASIRAVCRALRVDIRYGIVAAGMFTAEEMKLKARPSNRELLRTYKSEELTDELLRRVDEKGVKSAARVGTFEEQHRPVVGPIQFQDGRAG